MEPDPNTRRHVALVFGIFVALSGGTAYFAVAAIAEMLAR
jgi:hypothetical protein